MGGEDPQVRGEERATHDAHIRTFLIADVRGYTLFTQELGNEALKGVPERRRPYRVVS
jgi:hypothetical protein